jgi:hypothetical protein
VPTILRAAGLRLVTLAERYGIPEDETIPDEQWLTDAGSHGEVVFMKDARVRYRLAEKLAVVQSRVRCFCLARQDLPGSEMAERFLSNLDRIVAARRDPGPLMYSVHKDRIERVQL